MPHRTLVTRPIVAVLIAAWLSVPTAGLAQQSGPETPSADVPRPEQTLLASALRAASAEPLRDASDRQDRAAAAAPTCDCRASIAEKLAWLYALVGGSIMLVTGPQEKEGDLWTVDGKSETVAGAAAVVLSFALLKDIRKKRAGVHQP